MAAVELTPTGASGGAQDHITVAFLDDLNERRAQLDALVATIECVDEVARVRVARLAAAHGRSPCCTYNIDSIADGVAGGASYSAADDSAALAAETERGTAALAAGKRLLDALKADGEALGRAHPGSQRITAYRAAYLRLAKAFVDAARAHQQAKERVRAVEVDALVATAVQRAGGAPVDEAELRRQAARDPVAFAAKQQQLARPPSSAVVGAASTFDEDAARAHDIAALVRSTLEVQRLFTDVSALVAHQGEALDTVEAHVEAAGLHAVKGNAQLEAAIRKRRRRRRCMCCLCGTGAVLLVLAIIALSLFVTGAYKAIIP